MSRWVFTSLLAAPLHMQVLLQHAGKRARVSDGLELAARELGRRTDLQHDLDMRNISIQHSAVGNARRTRADAAFWIHVSSAV